MHASSSTLVFVVLHDGVDGLHDGHDQQKHSGSK
uniref:Uncharacterized protein n=1 Tax=Arundo donax TaxID=35708 RepID=A0A0A9SFJ7_ARUDO